MSFGVHKTTLGIIYLAHGVRDKCKWHNWHFHILLCAEIFWIVLYHHMQIHEIDKIHSGMHWHTTHWIDMRIRFWEGAKENNSVCSTRWYSLSISCFRPHHSRPITKCSLARLSILVIVHNKNSFISFRISSGPVTTDF